MSLREGGRERGRVRERMMEEWGIERDREREECCRPSVFRSHGKFSPIPFPRNKQNIVLLFSNLLKAIHTTFNSIVCDSRIKIHDPRIRMIILRRIIQLWWQHRMYSSLFCTFLFLGVSWGVKEKYKSSNAKRTKERKENTSWKARKSKN